MLFHPSRLLQGPAFVISLLAGAFVAQAEPFQHPFGELREYHRHWLAVCPNVHEPQSASSYQTDCWASTFTGNPDGTFTGDFPGDRLSVHRNRDTGAMHIRFVSVLSDMIDQSRPVTVRFSNGAVLQLPYNEGVSTMENSLNEYTFLRDADTADIVKRLKAASHVVITLPTSDGEHRMQFSAIGLKRALGFLEQYAL